MAFSPENLIPHLPAGKATLYVAFSGGMDSHVLLHALAWLRDEGRWQGKLHAIHVHHGLSEHADTWAKHCRVTCKAMHIPLEVIRVNVEQAGQGLENAARVARLAAFEAQLEPGDWLLTAHHLDDQMETVLYRMMRGTGLRGLAGIRQHRPLGKGTMLRPMLDFSRAELKEFAEREGLAWIEDESNLDENLDRNFLRRKVIPLLASRWPGYRKNWQRLARLAEEAEMLQQELGRDDLTEVLDGIHRLSIAALLEFSPLRRGNILRSWFLALEDQHHIPSPDYYVIERILTELIPAAEDAEPLVSWHKGGLDVEVRRFASRIYLVLPGSSFDQKATWSWNPENPLDLPGSLGRLTLVESGESGFVLPPGSRLDVGFRQGGESARPAGRKTRTLKKLLQDYSVPPWLRDSVPLVSLDGDLVAVGDLFVCDKFSVKKTGAKGEKLHRIQWDRPDLHCGY